MLPTRPGRSLHWREFGRDFEAPTASPPLLIGQKANKFENTSKMSTLDYWVFGLFPSSGILENRKHDVSETGSVSVLR
jgi:hypothetical protein